MASHEGRRRDARLAAVSGRWPGPPAHVSYDQLVTLILGMSQPEGIYLSVDYRVTDSRSGQVLDDAATKHLTVHYPPTDGGPRALVAYTGVAVLPDGTRTGDWVRETLRGESDVVDDSMRHLRERLDRDYGRLRQPLIINFLVSHAQRRYVGGMSNIRDNGGRISIQPSFGYQLSELTKPFMFGNGSGANAGSSQRHLDRLRRQLGQAPNRPRDYMKLMALVNRGIAGTERTVSPYCHVAFIPDPSFKFGPESNAFTEPGETAPLEFPMLLFGIDLTGMMTRFMHHSQEFFAGRIAQLPESDPDEINEELKRRP